MPGVGSAQGGPQRVLATILSAHPAPTGSGAPWAVGERCFSSPLPWSGVQGQLQAQGSLGVGLEVADALLVRKKTVGTKAQSDTPFIDSCCPSGGHMAQPTTWLARWI